MWIPPPTRAGSGGNRSCVSPSRRITAAAQQGAGHCSSWNVLTGVHDFGTRRASNALWLIAIGSSQFFWRSKAAKPSRPSGCRAAAAALFDARSAPTAMSVQERRRRWHRDDSLLSDEPHERTLVLVLDQVAFGVARTPVRRSTVRQTKNARRSLVGRLHGSTLMHPKAALGGVLRPAGREMVLTPGNRNQHQLRRMMRPEIWLGYRVLLTWPPRPMVT